MLTTRILHPQGWRGALSDMDRLRQEMGRLLGAMSGEVDKYSSAGVFPLVNIVQNADSYVVTAELPGVRPEDIELSVMGKNLGVKGERKPPELPEGVRFHRRERTYPKFNRLLGLPDEVDAEKVTATVQNGVLTIVLPKAEAAKPRKISVTTA